MGKISSSVDPTAGKLRNEYQVILKFMKRLLLPCFLALSVTLLALVGCSGSGGPVERTGRAVDNAVYNVGTGVKRTGQAIQNAAD